MPILNKKFGGLNTRSNDIDRPDTDASDMQNVEPDKKGDLVKIDGMETVDATFGATNIHAYNELDYVVGIGSAVKYYDGTSTSTAPNAGGNTLDNTYKTTAIEINKNLYFANGKNELMKFDGLAWYRAGAPAGNTMAITQLANYGASGHSANIYYFAVQFVTHDKNGITSFGDISTTIATNVTPSISSTYLGVSFTTYSPTIFYSASSGAYKWLQNVLYNSAGISTIYLAPDNKYYKIRITHTSSNTGTALEDFQKDLNAGYWYQVSVDEPGWNNKTAIVDGSQTNVTTVTVDIGHNIEVGDYIYVPPTDSFKLLQSSAELFNQISPEWEYWREVTATTATSITFDGVPTDFVTGYPLTAGMVMYVYAKNSTTNSDWFLIAIEPVDGTRPNQDIVVDNFRDSAGNIQSLGDIIDSEILVENSSKGRYLATIQNNIVVAGVEDSPNSVYWSIPDESGEVFNAGTYSLTVKDDYSGIITGVKGYDDYLLITCERAMFMAAGEFGTNNIKVWRVEGSEAGADSAYAMQNIEGKCFYLSDKGVYAVGFGSKRPEEIGWKINNTITDDSDIDIGSCLSFNRRIKQQYWLYVKKSADSYFLVYDYFYNVWLKHKATGLDADNGVCEVNQLLYICNSSGELLEQTPGAYNIDGTPVNAYYASEWIHFGDPGVDKKYINWKGFVLGTEAFTLTLRTQKNFKQTDITDYDIVIDGAVDFDYRHKLTQIKGQSMRFIMQSELDEPMRISHWQVEYETPEEKMKK